MKRIPPLRSSSRLPAALLVILLILELPAFAETPTGETIPTDTAPTTAGSTTPNTEAETEKVDESKPEPYKAEEFPQWARDLRRADIIAFGSLPFTLFFTKFSIDFHRYAQNDWDRRYAPWPLKSAGSIEMSEDQKITALVAAGAFSVVLAIVDHLIVKGRRRSAARAAEARIPPAITIERKGRSPGVDLPTPETAPPPSSDPGRAEEAGPPVDGAD